MNFTPHGANERKDVDRVGPGCGEFPKGERVQPDNLCGAHILAKKGRVYWEIPVLASLLFFVGFAGCAITRTGGDYLSIPAPTRPHAPGAVEMPPKPAEAEYR
jgi:hypothetical protein